MQKYKALNLTYILISVGVLVAWLLTCLFMNKDSKDTEDRNAIQYWIGGTGRFTIFAIAVLIL